MEVTVVATILSLLTMITASTLYSLNSTTRRMREGTAWQASVADLSQRLRRDVHQAPQVSLRRDERGNVNGLTVQLEHDRSVQYETSAGGVRRTVRRADQFLHRDLFRLHAARQSVRWMLSENPPQRVILVIGQASERTSRSEAATPRTITIEAVVGLLPAAVVEAQGDATGSPAILPAEEQSSNADSGLPGDGKAAP
jgi:hypothetical protein